MTKVYHRSTKHDWETPPDLFAVLNREFAFTLDAAALAATAKCSRYFTPKDDGLAQDWGQDRVWLNPPYGRAVPRWLQKSAEAARGGALVVCLIAAHPGTGYWWNAVWPHVHEIRFLKGRLKFLQDGQPVKSGAGFDSAVLVYRPGPPPAEPWVTPWDWRSGQRPGELRPLHHQLRLEVVA